MNTAKVIFIGVLLIALVISNVACTPKEVSGSLSGSEQKVEAKEKQIISKEDFLRIVKESQDYQSYSPYIGPEEPLVQELKNGSDILSYTAIVSYLDPDNAGNTIKMNSTLFFTYMISQQKLTVTDYNYSHFMKDGIVDVTDLKTKLVTHLDAKTNLNLKARLDEMKALEESVSQPKN